MTRFRIASLVMAGALAVSSAWAEDLTFTTYYPAPSASSGGVNKLQKASVAGDPAYGTALDTAANGTLLIQGPVGIGTTTPADQLELTGNLRLPATSATAGIIKLGGHTFLHAFGTSNTFLGDSAGNLAMTGVNNTALGFHALTNDTDGQNNTAVGINALTNNSRGTGNTALGMNALLSNTTGQQNTAVGLNALYTNNASIGNTAVGVNALSQSTTASNNTAIGLNALNSTTTGQTNTAMGVNALYSNTTGSSNTALGLTAGYGNVTGTGNVFLGYQAGYNETGSNKLYIANGSGVPLIYGDFSAGTVGIGTAPASGTRLGVQTPTPDAASNVAVSAQVSAGIGINAASTTGRAIYAQATGSGSNAYGIYVTAPNTTALYVDSGKVQIGNGGTAFSKLMHGQTVVAGLSIPAAGGTAVRNVAVSSLPAGSRVFATIEGGDVNYILLMAQVPSAGTLQLTFKNLGGIGSAANETVDYLAITP